MAEVLELKLVRYIFNDKRTIGRLYADGVKVADTLEDTRRELPGSCPNSPFGRACTCREKIYGQTCIPEGRYRVTYSYSPKFKREYPRLERVPHFLGVLIHAGTTEDHSQGCILVGTLSVSGTKLKDSFAARDRVCKIVQDALAAGKEVWITVE